VTSYGASPEEDGSLQALFNASPDLEVHTSAAAETAFLLGLVALFAAPFSIMYTVSLGAGVLGVLCALIGVATTSRPNVAGGALAPFGLAFACTALLLVGLRYVGLDTAFGDGLAPTIRGWLENVNARLPGP
jgi:hypothetical protein